MPPVPSYTGTGSLMSWAPVPHADTKILAPSASHYYTTTEAAASWSSDFPGEPSRIVSELSFSSYIILSLFSDETEESQEAACYNVPVLIGLGTYTAAATLTLLSIGCRRLSRWWRGTGSDTNSSPPVPALHQTIQVAASPAGPGQPDRVGKAPQADLLI